MISLTGSPKYHLQYLTRNVLIKEQGKSNISHSTAKKIRFNVSLDIGAIQDTPGPELPDPKIKQAFSVSILNCSTLLTKH